MKFHDGLYLEFIPIFQGFLLNFQFNDFLKVKDKLVIDSVGFELLPYQLDRDLAEFVKLFHHILGKCVEFVVFPLGKVLFIGILDIHHGLQTSGTTGSNGHHSRGTLHITLSRLNPKDLLLQHSALESVHQSRDTQLEGFLQCVKDLVL